MQQLSLFSQAIKEVQQQIQVWGVFRGRYTYTPQTFHKEVMEEGKGISIASTAVPQVYLGDILVVVMGLEKGSRKEVKEIPLAILGAGVVNEVIINPKTYEAREFLAKCKAKLNIPNSTTPPLLETRRCGTICARVIQIDAEKINMLLDLIREDKNMRHKFMLLIRCTKTYFATPQPIPISVRKPFLRGLFRFTPEEVNEIMETLKFEWEASSLLGGEIYSPRLGEMVEYVKVIGKQKDT